MMKTRTVLGIVLSLLILTLFGSAVLAGGMGKSGAEKGAVYGDQVRFEGLVLSGPGGYILETGSHTFILEGENLEDFEGKSVSVTGRIEDQLGGWDKLTIDQIEESMGFR